MSDATTPGPDERGESTTPVTSSRQRKRVERTSAALGVPVIATASFWVEGTLPCVFIGFLVTFAVIQGALGALIGLGVGYGIAWLVTRGRAGGAPLLTILAVTATDLCVLRASFWTGRPVADKQVGSWPLNTVDIQVRHKRITTAVSIGLPDGRRMRLETTGRKRSAALVAQLPNATP